jgi:hypothetical protein
MNIYFTVQPRGAKYRVVDYEGKVIGAPFDFRESAESYADALNQARNRRQRRDAPTIPLLTISPPVLPLATTPTLWQKLQRLAVKAHRYQFTRLGL